MDHVNLSAPAMADAAPTRSGFGGNEAISARLQQALALLFPSNLAAKAVLFAVVVALLPLLLPTSQAPRFWELPHILLLGLIISYGVFGQRNADDDEEVPPVAAAKIVDDDESVESYVSQILQGPLLVFEGNAGDDGRTESNAGGVQAWSSQYFPDDTLVVVADTGSKSDAGEMPLLLPVRKLKPAVQESATGSVSDHGVDEEGEFLLPNSNEGGGYGSARDHVTSSPSSVLDAGLTLSPSSPPPPPARQEFLGGARRLGKAKARSFNEYAVGDLKMSGRPGIRSGGGGHRFRSNSARRSSFAIYDYDPVPVVPDDDQGAADDELDDKAAASDSSFSSDDMARDGDDEGGEGYEEEDERREGDNSSDEELLELAKRPGPEEAEVDRKADEFIAKFREQIRMQRVEPGRR